MLAEAIANRQVHFVKQHVSTLLRKGGVINVAASLFFLPVWGVLCLLVVAFSGLQGLWVLELLNVWFALALYRRYRLIVDTATSRLSSTAQGYVELEGQARLPEGEGFRGLQDLPPTVWLAGFIEDQVFVLEDDDGRCVLYPKSAEIVIQPADNHLYWLQAIYPGQTLYALGELRTHSADNQWQSHRHRISEVLADWKQNPRQLLNNFDANGNGQLDPDEWERVKVSAANVAESMVQEQRSKPVTHVLERPRDGRVFLITNVPPQQLARRYRVASWMQMLLSAGLLFAVLF